MTRLATALTAAVIAISAVPVNAQFLNWGGAANDVPTQNTTHYRLEAAGTDFDAYEWVSPGRDSVLCVAVSSRNTGPVGHTCVDIGEPVTLRSNPSTVDSLGYTIDTRWTRARVYEWHMVNAEGVLCSVMSNNDGKFGIQCTND